MDFNYLNNDPSSEEIRANLIKADEVARKSMEEGKHPFGAVLTAPDHHTVLLSQGNIDAVNHAESTLARLAADDYPPEFLWNCTLYTTVEPCAMCATTAYWANIGRIVFGVTEKQLLGLTGAHEENPTMDLPCREVFTRGQKPIKVYGPIAELNDALLDPHRTFWTDNE